MPNRISYEQNQSKVNKSEQSGGRKKRQLSIRLVLYFYFIATGYTKADQRLYLPSSHFMLVMANKI
jgi:hypothetical protein